MTDPIKIVAQISGFKKLKIEGGWRLQVDLFEAREMDVLLVAALANRSMVVEMEIGPHEAKTDDAREQGKDG